MSYTGVGARKSGSDRPVPQAKGAKVNGPNNRILERFRPAGHPGGGVDTLPGGGGQAVGLAGQVCRAGGPPIGPSGGRAYRQRGSLARGCALGARPAGRPAAGPRRLGRVLAVQGASLGGTNFGGPWAAKVGLCYNSDMCSSPISGEKMSQKQIEVILTRQLASYLAVPIFIADAAGTLVYYNEPAEMILGRRFDETGEMPANEWSTIFRPTDAEGTPVLPERLPLAIALSERRPAPLTFWMRGL